MLKSIYNWIRYKTITPSFYARNRLFIERGDKHRRIFSNLGLVFRNSKWASYVKENLSYSSYSSTLSSWRNTLVIAFLLVLSVLTPSYIWPTELQDWSLAQIWYLVDEFARTSLLVLFTLYWNITQQFEELLNFLLNVPKESTSADSKFVTKNQKSNKLTKRDKKDLVYRLTNSPRFSDDKFLKSFYQSSKSSLYKDLFTTYTKVFNPSTVTNNYSHSNLWQVYNLESTRHNIKSLNSSLPPVLRLNTPGNEASRTSANPSMWLLNHTTQWSLDRIVSSSTTSNYKNSVIGQYVLSSRDLSQSYTSSVKSPLLLPLTPSLKEQTNWIKVSRWLSRYSILHRRTIADSHKLTMSKRLIGSGFYDSSLDTLNINNSSVKALSSDWASLYQSLFSQSYGNFFNPYTNNLLTSSKKTTELTPKFTHLLSFHEDSLSWVTKRFYLFNNLSTNSNQYNLKLNLNSLKSSRSVTSEQNIDNFLSLQNNLPTYLIQSNLMNSPLALDSLKSDSGNMPLNPFVVYDFKEELFSLDYSESAMLLLQKPSYSANQQTVWGSSLNLKDFSSFNLSSTQSHNFKGLTLTPDYSSWSESNTRSIPNVTYNFVNGRTSLGRRTDFWRFVRSQTTDYTKPRKTSITLIKKN